MTLPAYGPLPRPANLLEARAALASEAFPAPPDLDWIEFEGDEFTANCPRTGQPDFYRIVIRYRPTDRCLESKAVKFYLWAWRDQGAFAETLASTIRDDIRAAIAPVQVEVTLHQAKRGGLSLTARACG